MSQRPAQRRAIPSAPPESFFAALSPDSEAAVVGGKARSLGRLAAAGHATPPGFVVRDRIARALLGAPPRWPRVLDEKAMRRLITHAHRIGTTAWPSGFLAALRARLARLPGRRFCVRSSFALEDARGRNAPGVYESVIDVAATDVPEAIRKVVASALSPGAVAYALAAGRDPLATPLAVLIHPHVDASATGHAVITAAGRKKKVSLWIRRGRLTERQQRRLTTRLERSALRSPVELEWAAHAGGFTFLQARPFDGAPAPTPPPGGTGTANPRAWHWDAAHNPLPLSPAQADLVALVDRQSQVGFRQRVVGGYLVHRRDQRRAAAPLPASAARALFKRLDRATARELTRIQTLTSPVEALRAARALFLSTYQPLLGAIGRTVRDARNALADFLAARVADLAGLQGDLLRGVRSAATRRRAAWQAVGAARGRRARMRAWRRYQTEFGADTPIWDVASATVGEQALGAAQPASFSRSRSAPPTASAHAAARRVRARLSRAARGEFDRRLRAARAAAALGEDDDWLYARLQAAVRHALLRLGRSLTAAAILTRADDVFYLPIDASLALARAGLPHRALKAAIARARARTRAQALKPPPTARRPSPGARPGLVTGVGVGGRVIGRVRHHPPRAPAPRRRGGPGVVLVARTLLPTELPLLNACALVTETGGWLDHVAAQARERNLPAVVGAQGALDQFSDGDLVLVDGSRGLVQRLGLAARRLR